MSLPSSSVSPLLAATQFVEQLTQLDPSLSLEQLFRVGSLLLLHADKSRLNDPEYIKDTWLELTLRLQAAADQQSAVSEELESLANTDPQKFSPNQVWTLIKAIKVLSQTLEFYAK